MKFNRKVLSAVSTLGVIPFKFVDGGRTIASRISNARLTFWKILLFMSTLNSLYITVTLILSFLVPLGSNGHQSLAVHINRALLSVAFNFWAYELFLSRREGTILLYNFSQKNHG